MYHPYIDVSTPYDSYNSKNIAELSTWTFYEELYSMHLEIQKDINYLIWYLDTYTQYSVSIFLNNCF